MDLAEIIRWAGRAVLQGTEANNVLLAGLRSVLHITGRVDLTNPVSSALDGTSADLTPVILCEVEDWGKGQRFCVKLYSGCPEGRAALDRHSLFLSRLRNTVPVPEVIEVVSQTDLFGFPALVTTASGWPLDRELEKVSSVAQMAVMVSIAQSLAALHDLDPSGLPIDAKYDPKCVDHLWQEDVEWYNDHAGKAGEFADLVREGAMKLADYHDVPNSGSVLHRDLTPYNIMAEDGDLVAIIDWDHAGYSAAQEDVGKAIVGILGMLSLPRDIRLPLARSFLHAYSEARSLSPQELLIQSIPFALDTILDWVVGGKNAPRDELAWATKQMLEYEHLLQAT